VHQCLRDNRDKLSEACRREETKLAIIESSNTELMPNLARACKARAPRAPRRRGRSVQPGAPATAACQVAALSREPLRRVARCVRSKAAGGTDGGWPDGRER